MSRLAIAGLALWLCAGCVSGAGLLGGGPGAQQRQKRIRQPMSVGQRQVLSLAEAREALARLVGEAGEWTAIDGYLTRYMSSHGLPVETMSATVRASSLSAMLEMVREGLLDLRQDGAFAPLYVRRRSARPPTLGL